MTTSILYWPWYGGCGWCEILCPASVFQFRLGKVLSYRYVEDWSDIPARFLLECLRWCNRTPVEKCTMESHRSSVAKHNYRQGKTTSYQSYLLTKILTWPNHASLFLLMMQPSSSCLRSVSLNFKKKKNAKLEVKNSKKREEKKEKGEEEEEKEGD